MKSLIVYGVGDKWFGSEVNWKRSGSGSYRETSPVEVPQGRAEIVKWAKENGFSIEWRHPLPDESEAPANRAQGAATA
ncbi:MAG TPA: hypothetical protein VGY53_06645 [Isosphaeraceae bacterium]|nr:hypothetical protein [Isosphaeraceae bacterium]